MRKPFCCDATKHLYESYYLDQHGRGLPVFSGSRRQKGHGLGSILGGLFRSALPMLKRGLASFGRHALKTGLDIANDVVEGDGFKTSARRRIPEGIKRFATAQNIIPQRGRGRRKRKLARVDFSVAKSATSKKKRVKRRKTRSHREKDIFD